MCDLTHPIESKHLLETDIFVTFEQIYSPSRNVKDERKSDSKSCKLLMVFV